MLLLYEWRKALLMGNISPSVSSSYVSVSLPRIRRYLPLLLHFPLLFMLTIRYLGEITNVLGLKIMKLLGDN